VIVTIFLNPLQFRPDEDLAWYPRQLESDLEVCRAEGADLVFAPGPAEVYPDGPPDMRISAGPLGAKLEGAFRPGHPDGMLTVVAKLLHLTRPRVALFGQKDAQQLLMIQHMVRDLDFGCRIISVPTVRDPDGLALSSRNAYLSAAEREWARALALALYAGEAAGPAGPDAVRAAARAVLVAQPRVRVDYLVLADPQSLDDVAEGYQGEALLLLAAWVGTTRLIDNVPVLVGERDDRSPSDLGSGTERCTPTNPD
jgi:pantoate--beta-alanine ligase